MAFFSSNWWASNQFASNWFGPEEAADPNAMSAALTGTATLTATLTAVAASPGGGNSSLLAWSSGIRYIMPPDVDLEQTESPATVLALPTLALELRLGKAKAVSRQAAPVKRREKAAPVQEAKRQGVRLPALSLADLLPRLESYAAERVQETFLALGLIEECVMPDTAELIAEVRALVGELCERSGLPVPAVSDGRIGALLESFAPSASSGDVAIGGRRGNAVEAMLEASVRYGSRILEDITRAAVSRLLAKGDIGAQQAGTLFTDEERERLVEALAAVNGTADQLARAQLRDYLRIMEERHGGARESAADSPGWITEAADRPFEPLPPEQAVDYFKSLVPTLGTDPLFFGEAMRRQAFTLAVQTETEVLGKVQRSILDLLETGQEVRATPAKIAGILESSGITQTVGGRPISGAYVEMVMRTNYLNAANTAADEERMDPDVIDAFPWWQYSSVADGRSRPHHAARDGKYYDASVSFMEVRGTDISEAANCRCTQIPIYKSEVERLKARGKTTETSW